MHSKRKREQECLHTWPQQQQSRTNEYSAANFVPLFYCQECTINAVETNCSLTVMAIGQAMFHPTCGPPTPSPAEPEKKNGLVAAARSDGRVEA